MRSCGTGCQPKHPRTSHVASLYFVRVGTYEMMRTIFTIPPFQFFPIFWQRPLTAAAAFLASACSSSVIHLLTRFPRRRGAGRNEKRGKRNIKGRETREERLWGSRLACETLRGGLSKSCPCWGKIVCEEYRVS